MTKHKCSFWINCLFAWIQGATTITTIDVRRIMFFSNVNLHKSIAIAIEYINTQQPDLMLGMIIVGYQFD